MEIPSLILMLSNGQIGMSIFGCLVALGLSLVGFLCKKDTKTELFLVTIFSIFPLYASIHIANEIYINITTKRPLIAFYNEGLCYYNSDISNNFYDWNKISKIEIKTGKYKNLIFVYDEKDYVSIPKLTMRLSKMKTRFETFIAQSQLEPKSDSSFQCPDLNEIVSNNQNHGMQ
jgi:hypothetical protein